MIYIWLPRAAAHVSEAMQTDWHGECEGGKQDTETRGCEAPSGVPPVPSMMSTGEPAVAVSMTPAPSHGTVTPSLHIRRPAALASTHGASSKAGALSCLERLHAALCQQVTQNKN